MEEKQENISIRWPVKWANISKRLAKIGWWAVLLTIILFVVGIIVMEGLLDLPRPSMPERFWGITLTILFYCTILCFLSSFIAGIASLFAPLFSIVSYKEVKTNALRGISYSLLYFTIFLVLMTPPIMRRIKVAQSQCRWNQRILCREILDRPKIITQNWCDALKNKPTFDSDSLKCNYDKTGPCSYAMNENIPNDVTDLPDDLVLLFESAPGWNQAGGPDDVVTDRHGRPGANIAFADGTVQFVKPEDIPTLRWTVEDKND